MRTLLAVLSSCLMVVAVGSRETIAQDLPTVESFVSGFDKIDGFFDVYWDGDGGKVWLEVADIGGDFLYVGSLAAGLGSNDVGLDRGQLGPRMVARFERVGGRLFLAVPNLTYRADGAGEAETRAVTDAFAQGIEWSFPIEAEGAGRVLVDVTGFLLRDVHGVALSLDRTRQGRYKLDQDRSSPVPDGLKSFPDNTEMEVRLTFALENPSRADAQPGSFVRSVAAVPQSITVRVRHSFVRLPSSDYVARANHPGSGFFGVTYRDYAGTIGADMTRRLIARHRLEKVDPSAEKSPVVEPIVYYLDPGTPEPVRSALLEGASWWADAFEAAGFVDAFRVEMLPEGADMLDVRYNVIQWVHRATRGWSYGSTVLDPRTGEILKGHVSLGSLRVRQDYLLAEGLLSPYSGEHASGFPAVEDPMLEMALARIRQLSAHEVGHTLGLMHNFAASTYGRASVMDYPAPLITLAGADDLSLRNAYAVGVGEWDEWAIRFGYASVPPGGTEESLRKSLLEEAASNGLLYLTDADARAEGTMHPSSTLWDNGDDAVAALRDAMEVRRRALSRFGESAIRAGQPLASIEEAFVPLYLHHRYQLAGTAKVIGGMRYEYALREDRPVSVKPVGGSEQRAALEQILSTLSPESLRLPTQLRGLIHPRPPGYPRSRELFSGRTDPAFDPYMPAEVLAGMTIDLLLNPQRAARLVYQHDFDSGAPGLTETLIAATTRLWKTPVAADDRDAELQRAVQQVWVDALLEASSGSTHGPAVRSRTIVALSELAKWISENPGDDPETRAHRAFVGREIDQFLTHGRTADRSQVRAVIPPGSPIGSDGSVLDRIRSRRAHAAEWATDECSTTDVSH